MTDWTHVDAIFRRSSAQEPDCWRTWPIKIQVNWARLNAHQEPDARFAPKLIQNIDMSVAYSTKKLQKFPKYNFLYQVRINVIFDIDHLSSPRERWQS